MLVSMETAAAIGSHVLDIELQDLQPATTAKYKQCLRDYQAFLCDEPISEHSAKLFLSSLRNRGLKTVTIELYYHALRPLLLANGVMLKMRFKKHKTLPAYHTADQVKAVLAEIPKRSDNWSGLVERDTLLILVLAYTGIRRSELLSLKLSDVDLYNRTIRVRGKGGNERIIPLSPHVFDKLKIYATLMQPSDRLFPIKARRAWQIVSNYARQAGINDLHPHSFRHFFATQLVEQGVPLHIIKELLGHADISTTAIYLDVLPRHLTAAVLALPDLEG